MIESRRPGRGTGGGNTAERLASTDDTGTVDGYATAFDIYHRRGWAVMPIPRGKKLPPPTGFTGHNGATPSYADMMEWAQDRPDDGAAIRMVSGVAGIDVDHYGAKRGADTLAEAETRWGTLPPTWRSTSRDDGKSGIRLFRIPEGVELQTGIKFLELELGGIEICQHHHRYVLCWPSIHERTGKVYWWINELDGSVSDEPPALDDIPELPAKWIEALAVAPAHNGAVVPAGLPADVPGCITGGEMSTRVLGKLSEAMGELFGPHCRHDEIRDHVLGLLRCGKDGEPGVKQALNALSEAFVNRVAKDRDGGKAEARREFKSFVFGDKVPKLLADNRYETPTGTTSMGSADDVPLETQSDTPPLEDIEQGFWTSRDSLETIYNAALARMCSPWAVLGCCAARALTQVRPNCTLPPLIGGPGSLNWFCAIVAKSGVGKGAALQVARQLVPRYIFTRNLGSGEGLVDAYCCKSDAENPDGIRESVMFVANEIDSVNALAKRNGSNLLPTLRLGFSGEKLGFSYRGKPLHIAEDSYRMTLIMATQPTRAGWLFDDENGGTPQRFIWLPATDHRISVNRPYWDGKPLALPGPKSWLYPVQLTVPGDAETLILAEQAKRNSGQTDALDGHALFVREKFAFALAVLDGRDRMNDEDWALAGIAMAVSDHTRTWVTQAARQAKEAEATEKGIQQGISAAAASVSKAQQDWKRARRIENWILGKLKAAGPQGMSEVDLKRAAYNPDRPSIAPALARLADDGAVKWIADTKKWVHGDFAS